LLNIYPENISGVFFASLRGAKNTLELIFGQIFIKLVYIKVKGLSSQIDLEI